ncbi:MAG TPA: FHA domain-containing protein [Steroidobacteraceae bacterium]|jgi:pSer/pThr/pTyr-binding forkhead associated (FHA) protein|nr:FHA domain-containing protein [Steroidobacteraceae bacterium]
MPQFRFFLQQVPDGPETEITGPLVVGHLPECGLRLPAGGPSGGPSRRHAQLGVEADKVWLEDLRSTNGTFVNGDRISARTQLKNGDRVRFDREEFAFRAEPTAPAEQHTQIRAPTVENAVASRGEQGYASWSDPEASRGSNKTAFIDPETLRQMQGQGGSTVPEGLDVPSLLVASGNRKGARIALRSEGAAKREWGIGSEPDREIVFDDKGVSGRHAKIVNEGARWKLVDQLASNGTFVNGSRTNLSFLSSGDRLRFGPVECVFLLPDSKGVAASLTGSKSRLIVIALASFLATIVILWLIYHLMHR